MVSKKLRHSCILYMKNTALYMSFNIIMSFNGHYVNFDTTKKCQLTYTFTIKCYHFQNRIYFVFAKASTVQSENNTVLL